MDFDSTLKQSSSPVVTDIVATAMSQSPTDSTPTQSSSPAGDTLASYPGTCDMLINPPQTVSTTINASQANVQVLLTAATSTIVSSPQTGKASSVPESAGTTRVETRVNVSISVNTSCNSVSTPMSSIEPNVHVPKEESREPSHKVKSYRDPKNLKYKQVSTLHDCTGSTESTIILQLDDWPHNSKYKSHHRPYQRPQMPTYDFDDVEGSSA